MARKKDVNRYKKVYASVRRTPRIVDIGTGVFEDLNLIKKTYPPLIKSTVYASASWRPPGPAAPAPGPGPGPGTDRWLEVRAQFLGIEVQESDAGIFELRTGFTSVPDTSLPTFDTTGTPEKPTAMGTYVAGGPQTVIDIGSVHTASNYPDAYQAWALPTGNGFAILQQLQPPMGAASDTWAEQTLVPTETIMIGDPLGADHDMVVFYGPIDAGTVCTLAVREGPQPVPSPTDPWLWQYPNEPNIHFSVRVWDVDPAPTSPGTTWPPADAAAPAAGVLDPGLDVIIQTSPDSTWPYAAGGTGLPDNNLNGAAGNGWSLWGLPSNYSLGVQGPDSDFNTDKGTWVPPTGPIGSNPRVYHVNSTQTDPLSPPPITWIAGSFTLL